MGEVVADGAEVVEGDVGEVGGPGAVAHGPDAGDGGFEAVVDADVSAWGGLDSGEVEAHVLGVGAAAGGDEEVCAFDDGFAGGLGDVDLDGCSGDAFDAGDGGVGDDVDVFVAEELLKGFGDVRVFPVEEAGIALDDGDAGTETAHGLGELEADVASAGDEEMLGEGVEFEGLDMGERLGFGEAGDGIDGGTGAGVNEDLWRGECAGASGVEVDLDGVDVEEAAETFDDFGAALFEIAEVDLVEAVDHFLATGTNFCHVDVPCVVDDAELRAALEEGRDFGAVDDVLGGKAGYVGAGSADLVLFDGGDTLALRAEMPGDEFSCFSGADDDGVVLFGCGQRKPP